MAKLTRTQGVLAVALAVALALVVPAAAQMVGSGPMGGSMMGGPMGGSMMGGPMGGSMMGGPMGGGMGGGAGAALVEPTTQDNEVAGYQFAIQALQTAIATYNENLGDPSYDTAGYDTDPEPNALKKELYRDLWALYDELGQHYRNRDQLVNAAYVYESALGFFPKPESAPAVGAGAMAGGMGGPMGSSGGPMMGSGGPMMGGSSVLGSSGGPMMGGAPMMGSGGPMMGGSAPMLGSGGPMMGGMGGGASAGGSADLWDDLKPDVQRFIRTGILASAYYRLGQVYYESYRGSDAVPVLDYSADNAGPESLLPAGPEEETQAGVDQSALGLLTQIKLMTGDPNVRSETTRLVLESQNSAAAWANHGIAMMRSGQQVEALRAFRRAVAIPVEQDARNVEAHVVAHNYMGVQELERGDLEAASASFRRMIDLLPMWDAQIPSSKRYSVYREGQRKLLSATVVAYSNLGIISTRRGQHQDAVAYQDAAVQAAELLLNLEQEDRGASIGDVDRAMSVVASAYQNAAMAYRTRGGDAKGERSREADYQMAREYLERAATCDPGNAATWNALGEMYYRLRRFGDAEVAFQEAVRLDGSVEAYRGNLTAVGERLGDRPR